MFRRFARKYSVIICSLVILQYGCSASEKVNEKEEKQKNDETYIFDEIPDNNVLIFEKPSETENVFYAIQIGAFSTEERAKEFAEKSRNLLNKEINISYNDVVKLYIVRLENIFSSRHEAEKLRDEIWTTDDYDDAWIVEVKKER
jgi:hypothetical protein